MEFALFQRKTPIIVGVDISSSSVKLLELSCSNNKYRVESYSVELLPPEAMQESEIKNVEMVGEALGRAVKRSRTHAKYGAVAATGSRVITKTIQMNANLTDKEMVTQIQYEAERHIPYPLSEVNIDFQVLGPSQKNPELMDVILAASRTENVDTLIEVLNLGGLKAKVVDIESYAIERAYGLIAKDMPNEAKDQTIAVFDIGATMMTFNVLHNGTTVYNREQIFGGKQLTEEIQRRYGLSFEEATIAKKQGGLPDDYTEQVLEPFKESVIQQINRSLQFFFSSSGFTEINHIILAGGTSSLPGLISRVQEKIGVPTTIANPFANMSIASRVSVATIHEDAPALMICCGLALRSFTHDHQS